MAGYRMIVREKKRKRTWGHRVLTWESGDWNHSGTGSLVADAAETAGPTPRVFYNNALGSKFWVSVLYLRLCETPDT